MRRLPLTCSVCGTALTGGLDTYGGIGAEVCQEHHFNPPEETDSPDDELRDILDRCPLEFDEDEDLDGAIEKVTDALDEAQSDIYEQQRDEYKDILDDLKVLRGARRDGRGKRQLARWKAVNS